MGKLSTHRVIQLSQLAYTCACSAASNSRAAAAAASIGNRAATRAFINKSSRLNAIGNRARQRLAVAA
jgi:hypothetical protein